MTNEPKTPAAQHGGEYPPCKGMHCGCTDGINHSLECQAEHAAAIAGGKFVKAAPAAVAGLDGDADWEIRGRLAASLTCWHRLTGAEADELVALAKSWSAPQPPAAAPAPIDMVLHCPQCGMQHVDAPEDAECDGEVVHSFGWSNPPHRSHLCHGCGHIWRPADVPTNGVQAIKTTGKADSPIAAPQPPAAAQEPVAWLHTNRLGGVQAFTNEPPPGLKEQCQPLYTHPAPQQAAPALGDAEDAARYRYLRECNSGSLVVVEITGTGDEDWHVLTEADADAAIDAARAQAQEGGE